MQKKFHVATHALWLGCVLFSAGMVWMTDITLDSGIIGVRLQVFRLCTRVFGMHMQAFAQAAAPFCLPSGTAGQAALFSRVGRVYALSLCSFFTAVSLACSVQSCLECTVKPGALACAVASEWAALLPVDAIVALLYIYSR